MIEGAYILKLEEVIGLVKKLNENKVGMKSKKNSMRVFYNYQKEETET